MILTVYLNNERTIRLPEGWTVNRVDLNRMRMPRRANMNPYEYDRATGILLLDEPLKDGDEVVVFSSSGVARFHCAEGQIQRGSAR